MTPSAAALAGLLFFGILTLFVDGRWVWSAFQVGVFFLAGWRLLRTQLVTVVPATLLLGLAAAWPWLQLAMGNSVSAGLTADAALTWLTLLAVFIVTRDVLSESEVQRWFLETLTLFGMLIAMVSTLQKYSSPANIFWVFPSGYPDGTMGPFVNRNQYAAWIELLLPIALYLAATIRRFRALFGVAAAVMFASVVASASRAGFVLVLAEVIVTLALLARVRAISRSTIVWAAVQFLAVALLAVAVMGSGGLQSRLEASQPETLRADAWRASLHMVKDRPWTGSGLGTWSTVYPGYASFDAGVFVNQAHNDWIEWAAEGGIPFAGLLAAFALVLCKSAFRSIYGLGAVALLLHALVDYPLQQRPALAACFFAVAAAASLWRGKHSVTV